MKIKWNDDNTIRVEPPLKPKKLTGTRFASVLGLNKWNTPFKTWCEMTKTYQEPFIDTKYTIAGKTIEPKQAQYVKSMYGLSGLITPAEVYGEDYFNKTFGDFYPENDIFGGMWDYLVTDSNGNIDSVIECKTTKRTEDWEDDIPLYYAMQGALYAYLKSVDKVIMVCSFLDEKDYAAPEKYKPSVRNTIVRGFKISEKFPEFESYIEKAKKFWEKNVLTGISPEYTDRDKDIISALRTTTVSLDDDIQTLVAETEALKKEVDEYNSKIVQKEKYLKELSETIKERCMSQFDGSQDTVCISGNTYTWEVKKSLRSEINKSQLKFDGLLDKYSLEKEVFTMRIKENKEENVNA